MVDDEFNGEERTNALRIATDFVDRFAHGGEIHDCRNAGEILEQNARGHEGNFFFFCARRPGGERFNVIGMNKSAVFTTEEIFEKDSQRKRKLCQVGDALLFEEFEALYIEGLRADVQFVARPKRVRHRDGDLVFLSRDKEHSMITEVTRRVLSPDSNAGGSDAILEKSCRLF